MANEKLLCLLFCCLFSSFALLKRVSFNIIVLYVYEKYIEKKVFLEKHARKKGLILLLFLREIIRPI